jgi:hypothetical protein
MTLSRSAAFFLALAAFLCCGNSVVTQPVLSLDRSNDGQRVMATVGQPIEITLQTIGPGEYGTPRISSTAVKFESVAIKMPANPGGPTQLYRLVAVAEGEAQVQIPHTASNPTFTVTFQVNKS